MSKRCFDDGRKSEIEVAVGDLGQAELVGDDLALFGGLHGPANRAGGLGQNRRVGRAAATADGAATTVEDRDLDPALVGDVGDRAQGLVNLPL